MNELRAVVIEQAVATAPESEQERIRAWCATQDARVDGLIADLLLTIRAIATLPA